MYLVLQSVWTVEVHNIFLNVISLLVEFGRVERENLPITATLVLFHPSNGPPPSSGPLLWPKGEAAGAGVYIGRPVPPLPPSLPLFMVMALIPFSEATDGAVQGEGKSHGGGGHGGGSSGHGLWGLGERENEIRN